MKKMRLVKEDLYAFIIMLTALVPTFSSAMYDSIKDYEFIKINEKTTIIIKSISWHGFEEQACVPFGLSTENYKAMMNGLRNYGYNAIEIPWSNQLIMSQEKKHDIAYEKNGDLKDLTSLEIFERIVHFAHAINLWIVLDYIQETSSCIPSISEKTIEDLFPQYRSIFLYKPKYLKG